MFDTQIVCDPSGRVAVFAGHDGGQFSVPGGCRITRWTWAVSSTSWADAKELAMNSVAAISLKLFMFSFI
jgi:hypothetical protein